MPSLSTARSKELEEITAELEKERTARKSIADEKKALEEELESLSQALFEEVRNSLLCTSPHAADVTCRLTTWSQPSEKYALRRKRS
jgi:septal ring factor EnvC (AmiA/AmiB activator)